MRKTTGRRWMITVLAMVLAFGMCAEASFAGSLGATFSKSGDLPGAIQNSGKYYGTQGVAFDTYTGQDAYVITLSKSNAKNAKLSHMKFVGGNWSIVKEVVYRNGVLGHANDATVYKKGNKGYIYIAKGGKGNKNACMVRLSDFDAGKAKVYKVKMPKLDRKSGKDLRGITYCGKMKVKVGKKNKKKDVFIIEAGRRLNKVYLKSVKKNVTTFAYVDSQRIKAPKYSGREGTANGIVYHNGSIYCVYGDEGKGGKNRTAMIEKISMKSLFKIKDRNKAKKFPSSWKKTYGEEFTPEGLFFTSLKGKGNLFMTCNGGGGSVHNDFIYKTSQTY